MSSKAASVRDDTRPSDPRPSPPGRRWLLWFLLVALVASMLLTLIWLSQRYDAERVQDTVDREADDATTDIRAALLRNVQTLQSLQVHAPQSTAWHDEAIAILMRHRELVRIEWRDTQLGIQAAADTPYRSPIFARLGRDNSLSDVQQACALATRQSSPAYAPSSFVSTNDGLGLEVMEMCMPMTHLGQAAGFIVATYALPEVLSEILGLRFGHGQEVSFADADDTRLAAFGDPVRGMRVFTARQLMGLPGTTMVLRIDHWYQRANMFPSVVNAIVALLSLALMSVVVLLGADIRKRLRVESDLAEALAFRKAMEDSLVTGLRARDLKGTIRYVNPAFCQMLGMEAEELLGSSAPAPYWPAERTDEYRQRQAVRLSGTLPPREGFQSVFKRKDGTLFPVLIIEAPLINAQGKQTGWMSAILDISEQRRMEELSRTTQDRLQATARLAAIGEMASLLSHELNQPLAAIASYATGSLNLLGQAPANAMEQDMQMALQRIAEQANRAGSVIKSVHDFVRRSEQSREWTAPDTVVETVRPLLELQARKLAIDLDIQLAPNLPQLWCDRTMVEQVLLNLGRNGMQAMRDPDTGASLGGGKKLAIAIGRMADQHGDWVQFAVHDQGVGISTEVAAQLFTPFFTTKAEGMGLGLSLCRTVIEQHGGSVWHQDAPGGGTIFSFTLPVPAPSPPP